ncbi:hypothetical protein [Caenibius sp. WL]|uniref:hypothetical protein n=1 Tax=Caenibius sp. WL TaxID=2872646 RepID=UPI001C9940B7|nr:hypothetical protein [Caenibius sp. WL]QZP09578.1 hypothetical protein K5X80_07525 [Caenibius sp. WL]
MNMLDMLRRTGGLSALSNRLALTPAQSMQIAGTFVPYLLAGFGRAFRREGKSAFLTRLRRLGGADMAQRALTPGAIAPSLGDAVLAVAFSTPAIVGRVERVLRDAVAIGAGDYREAMRLLALLLGGYLSARAEQVELGVADGIEALLDQAADDPLAAIETEEPSGQGE